MNPYHEWAEFLFDINWPWDVTFKRPEVVIRVGADGVREAQRMAPEGGRSGMDGAGMTFLEIAKQLADTRKAWAIEFLYQRAMHSKTDGHAKAAADERYIHDLTLLEARYELHKAELKANPHRVLEYENWRAIHGAAPDPGQDAHPEPEQADTDTEPAGQECGD